MSTAKAYAQHVTAVLEGPRSDSSIDPGGLTIWGFAASTRERLGLPDVMTKAEAEDAYIRHYWMTRGCNTMPDAVAWLVCDAFVNHSTRTAAKVVQQALGTVKIDGKFGPATLRACQDVADIRVFIKRYANARRGYYAGRSGELIGKYAKAGDAAKLDKAVTQEHGWQNRLDRLFDGMWQAGIIKPEQSQTQKITKTAAAATAAGATVAVATGAAQDTGIIDIASKAAELAVQGDLTATGVAVAAVGWAAKKIFNGGKLLPKWFRRG